jgi:hypothetical protein
MDRGVALYDTWEGTMSGHKFKMSQLVNYLGRERASGVYQTLSYCHQEAKRFSIA